MEKGSTIKGLLAVQKQCRREFDSKYAFVYDFIDRIWKFEGKVGLDREEMEKLNKTYYNQVITIILLATTADTSLSSSLTLLRNGLGSDAFGILRIVSEIIMLISFASSSSINADKVHLIFHEAERKRLSRENLPFTQKQLSMEQPKLEYSILQEAKKYFLEKHPDYKDVVNELNNYGAHISQKKIALAGTTILGDEAVSRTLMPNISSREFVKSIDIHVYMHLLLIRVMIDFFKRFTNVTGWENLFHSFFNEFNEKLHKRLLNIAEPE